VAAGRRQGRRTRLQGGPGGDHVVDQQHRLSRTRRPRPSKRALHVAQPAHPVEADLGRRVAEPPQPPGRTAQAEAPADEPLASASETTLHVIAMHAQSVAMSRIGLNDEHIVATVVASVSACLAVPRGEEARALYAARGMIPSDAGAASVVVAGVER